MNPEEWERIDREYVWHPFTQMKDYEKEGNLIINEGKGCYLKDIQGREYLDGVSSLWANIHGHRHPVIDQAIRNQLQKIAHSTLLGISNIPSVQLAQQLVEIAPPGLSKAFYSDDGATAVEIALKMAFQYWQQCENPQRLKTRFLSLKNSYHGDTLGAVSVGGIELFHAVYHPLLNSNFLAPSPYCYRCPFGTNVAKCNRECLKQLENIIQQHHQEIAALIIEPLVQGAGGIIVAPPGYLSRVRKLCDQYRILLIADEVAVGFGRTGEIFACVHEQVTPDFLILAKGITGGYLPLAATLTTENVYRAFWGEYSVKKTFFHGHTYTGNPLACAAAIANLDIFEQEQVLDKLQPKVAFLAEQLTTFGTLKHVGDVRQCGFIAGIELVRNKSTKEPYHWEEKIGIQVILEARKRGLIIRPLGNVIVIMPPLSISLKELEKLIAIVYESIRVVTE